MKHNIGIADRAARWLIASALIAFANIVPGITGILFLLGGVLLAVSSALGSCLFYTLLGINTNHKHAD